MHLTFLRSGMNLMVGGDIPHDKCVGYKVPLFLNGEDNISNLELSDIEVYWGIMGQMIAK